MIYNLSVLSLQLFFKPSIIFLKKLIELLFEEVSQGNMDNISLI